MRPLFVCFLLVLIGNGGFPAAGASFNCSKATTPQEKAICADPELSKRDEDTAAAYEALRNQLSAAGAREVQQDQREWLLWLRKICPDQKDQGRSIKVCLLNEYSARLQMLKGSLQRVEGAAFFPRLKIVTMPDTWTPEPGSIDPGFGVGRFSWPEIDKPTPQQALWNAAVRAQVVRMSTNTDEEHQSATDFDASDIANAEVDISYTLKAANKEFISVDLVNSRYEYGAPHPNEDVISFEWWVERKRALKAEDVFRSGSGWEVFLGQRCYEKLISGERAEALYEKDGVRRAVMDSVKQVSNWTLDARKFEVDFPEYSVASRAAGSISAELGWEELRPYLASGFNPALLPQPIESSPR